MSAQQLGRATRRVLDFDAHVLAHLGHLEWLVVVLDARDAAEVDELVLALPLAARLQTHGANGTADLEEAARDLHANDDGVARVEDELGKDFELEGKDGNVLEFFALFGLQLVTVADEFVEQVVDDIRCEDFDAYMVGMVLGIFFNLKFFFTNDDKRIDIVMGKCIG